MSSNLEEKTMSVRSPWPYLGLLFLTYILTMSNAYRLQPILPTVMKTLNIDEAQAGVLISAATITNIFITPFVGILIAKIGLRMAGLLSMVFLFSGTAIGSTVTAYHSIIIAMLLGGIGNAFIAVSGMAFVNLLFREGNRSTATGIFTSSGTAAQIITFLLLPRITAVGNIKPAWRIDMVLSFLCFMMWIIFVKKSMVTRLTEESERGSTDEKTPGSSASYVKSALKNPSIWKLILSLFLFVASIAGGVSYNPSYLVHVRGFELQFASLICSISAVVAFCSTVFGGFLSDRLNTNKWIFFTAALIMVATRLLQVYVPTASLIIAVILLQGLPGVGPSMVFSALTRAIPDPRERIIGVTMAMSAFLSGIAVSPIVFGYLIRAFGYNTSYIIMMPVTLISLIGVFSVKGVK